MPHFRSIAFTITISVTAFLGCHKASSPKNSAATELPVPGATGPVTFPDLGSGRIIQPGIRFQEIKLVRNGMPMRVWLYEPEKPSGKLPLVLVPPAGSTLIAGMDLGDGDRAEHYPYVKAGFAVVSFDIDGVVPDHSPDAVIKQGAMQFRNAQAGLANAKTALDFALAKDPNVDPKRIFIAGHSSAATLALLVAENESRMIPD